MTVSHNRVIQALIKLHWDPISGFSFNRQVGVISSLVCETCVIKNNTLLNQSCSRADYWLHLNKEGCERTLPQASKSKSGPSFNNKGDSSEA